MEKSNFHNSGVWGTKFSKSKPKNRRGSYAIFQWKLECGLMPNVMATLPNIGGALCSTPQSLIDAH